MGINSIKLCTVFHTCVSGHKSGVREMLISLLALIQPSISLRFASTGMWNAASVFTGSLLSAGAGGCPQCSSPAKVLGVVQSRAPRQEPEAVVECESPSHRRGRGQSLLLGSGPEFLGARLDASWGSPCP